MKILVIDIGGNNVKIQSSGQTEKRKFASGPDLTPQRMVAGVKELSTDWNYEAISIGFPGPVRNNRPEYEPINLAKGDWVNFDYERAFKHPVKMINDAAMQALGSYKGDKMLFLGLGTGLGTTLIDDGHIFAMELGHLPYKKKRTFEEYIGTAGLKRTGKKKWKKNVFNVVSILKAALLPDYIVLGGGNSKQLLERPPHTYLGNNTNAFLGGFRLWDEPHS
jgi:polyphosphate glucokinase